jgi:hypothetical protein
MKKKIEWTAENLRTRYEDEEDNELKLRTILQLQNLLSLDDVTVIRRRTIIACFQCWRKKRLQI